MTQSIIGAPISELTELMGRVVSDHGTCEMMSQSVSKLAPTIIHAGSTILWSLVRNIPLTICGTAIPIKAIGPVNAVAVPASRQHKIITVILIPPIDTPKPLAYLSPSSSALSFFGKKSDKIRQIIIIGAITFKNCQVTELKLPMLHITNNLSDSALLALCSTFTTEPAMLPNIIPTMSSETVSFTLLETPSTRSKTRSEPIIAAPTCAHVLATIAVGKNAPPISSSATPKLAPELIPSTYGPASGF